PFRRYQRTVDRRELNRIKQRCTISNHLANYNTRIASASHEAGFVKRRRQAILVWLSIFAIFTATHVAKGGPFQDFFRTVRSAIAHPKETPRPHRSTHKRKKTPPSDASNSQTSQTPTPAPGDQTDVRAHRAARTAGH